MSENLEQRVRGEIESKSKNIASYLGLEVIPIETAFSDELQTKYFYHAFSEKLLINKNYKEEKKEGEKEQKQEVDEKRDVLAGEIAKAYYFSLHKEDAEKYRKNFELLEEKDADEKARASRIGEFLKSDEVLTVVSETLSYLMSIVLCEDTGNYLKSQQQIKEYLPEAIGKIKEQEEKGEKTDILLKIKYIQPYKAYDAALKIYKSCKNDEELREKCKKLATSKPEDAYSFISGFFKQEEKTQEEKK